MSTPVEISPFGRLKIPHPRTLSIRGGEGTSRRNIGEPDQGMHHSQYEAEVDKPGLCDHQTFSPRCVLHLLAEATCQKSKISSLNWNASARPSKMPLKPCGGVSDQPATKRRGRPPKGKKRSMSPEGRQRQIAAMRRYWAAKKAGGKMAAKKATKKRGLTAAGRKALSENMKRMWAAKRAAAKKGH